MSKRNLFAPGILGNVQNGGVLLIAKKSLMLYHGKKSNAEKIVILSDLFAY